MNCRSQIFELAVEGRQIEEVVSCIFHTLLFHRTQGKFQFKQAGGSYSIGTVGTVDVDCDFVDFTYVRVECDQLEVAVRKEVTAFRDALRNAEGRQCGQINLEFYQKKKGNWPFNPESIPWELWTIKLDVVSFANEHERQKGQQQLHELLADKIMYIADAMNKHEYVPKMPLEQELDTVFDTSYTKVQPYLHKITFSTMEPSAASMGTTMRKLLRDTLAL